MLRTVHEKHERHENSLHERRNARHASGYPGIHGKYGAFCLHPVFRAFCVFRGRRFFTSYMHNIRK